jgi:hypothetical protein
MALYESTTQDASRPDRLVHHAPVGPGSRVSFSYVTRRVPRSSIRVVGGAAAPRVGSLVLATIEAFGQHTHLQLPDGRRRQIFLGDTVILAYGNRYAPRQFEAVVPGDLDACHLVAGGGVAARVLSRHDRMRPPTEIRPLGLLVDRSGRPLNLAEFALPPREAPAKRPLTLTVVGASMDSGKTTTAAYLARGLVRSGRRVGFAKVTGTGAGGDPWLLRDAGAEPVLDFTDAGHPSTYLVPLPELERIAATLVREISSAGVDVILLEIADGLFQHETAALLRSRCFRSLCDGFLFAAGDAMAAAAGVAWLRREGLPVLGVGGVLTAAPLGRREAFEATGLPVLGKVELADPIAAEKVVASVPPR